MGKPKASPPSNDMKDELNRGPWMPEEDKKLVDYISKHGHGRWRTLPKNAGLRRCGKSCRLRWINYLRPDVKRGGFSPEEEDTIMQLHSVLGNRWSAIAARLPGRTDNEIKNYWKTHIKRRIRLMGIDSIIHPPYFGLMNGFPMLGSSPYSLAQYGIDPSQCTDASSSYTSPGDHFLENRNIMLGNTQMQDVQTKFLPFQDYQHYTEARTDNQQLDCLIPSSYLYPQIITQIQRTNCQDCFESTIPTNMGCCEIMNTPGSKPSTSLDVSNNHIEIDGGCLYSDNVLFMSSSNNAHVPNNCYEFLSF